MNLLEYLGTEETNLLITLNNLGNEFAVFNRVDKLYVDALSNARISDEEDDLILLQLLLYAQFYYYYSAATLLRCHLSEAISSMRVGIDAGLTAYRIVEDRPSQVQYVERHKSFLYPKAFFQRERKNNPNAFPLAKPLLALRDACSQYGSHADIDSFVHRLELPKAPGEELKLQYFQHPKNRWDFGWWYLRLIHTFLMILQVFEKFLVQEKGFVTQEWASSTRQIGMQIEKLMIEARTKAETENQ